MDDTERHRVESDRAALQRVLNLLRDAGAHMPTAMLAIDDAETALGPFEDNLRTLIGHVEWALSETDLALGYAEGMV